MENNKVYKIGNVVIDTTYLDQVDTYSDGDVEEQILEEVKAKGEDGIRRELNDNDSWPFFYHFTKVRENIINWYQFKDNANVLEVGSGCGAITGSLCRQCASVTSLDLSERRCKINAYRHKDCSNLRILVGNFEKIASSITEKFDYVILIGVFEYAGVYIHTQNYADNFLTILNSLLKDDGRLIIAIENRLGLKYFAGAGEDHLGKAFVGIEGYQEDTKIRTYSRNEWEVILGRNGFMDYKFYYPYPDYKLPIYIFSDDKLPQAGELTHNVLNFDQQRIVTFDETKAFQSMVNSKDFTTFSNSYLIDIGKKQAE